MHISHYLGHVTFCMAAVVYTSSASVSFSEIRCARHNWAMLHDRAKHDEKRERGEEEDGEEEVDVQNACAFTPAQ